MKKIALVLILAPAAGCSTAPIAGFLDAVHPGRAKMTDTRPGGPPDRLPPATAKDDAFLDPPRFDK